VNDTGGFTMPYVVDLSYAAFQKLGGDQSQQVEVEVVAGP
jgi:rare lipoprotein A (peptidoglycan hydrolase)